jgi:hypothetical protein
MPTQSDEVKTLKLYRNGDFTSIEDPIHSYFEFGKGIVLKMVDLSEIGLGIVRYLGRGASSVVVTDEKRAYKISHHQGEDLDNLSIREYTVRKMGEMNGLLIPVSFIDYTSYKRYEEREGKKFPIPHHVSYNPDIKAFATYYAFNTLNVGIRDDGIIIQDLVPKDSKPTSTILGLTLRIANTTKKIYDIYLDTRGFNNTFFKEISPTAMLYRKENKVKTATGIVYLVDI